MRDSGASGEQILKTTAFRASASQSCPADTRPAPQEALDCACSLYLGDTTAWLNQLPTTNLRAQPLKDVSTRPGPSTRPGWWTVSVKLHGALNTLRCSL